MAACLSRECGGQKLPGTPYCRECLPEAAAEDLHRIQIADRRAW